MEDTRHEVLTAGAKGLGASPHLFAIEGTDDASDQPGDTVGAATRRDRIVELMRRLGDNPVDMLNLLKFKEGGEASYELYGQGFEKLVAKYAPDARVVYRANCAALLVGGQEWDHLLIARYPSVRAFLAVTASPEYEEIAGLRLDALERTVLYAMVPNGV
jgi:uncharacterized protein (DUF1330 family)